MPRSIWLCLCFVVAGLGPLGVFVASAGAQVVREGEPQQLASPPLADRYAPDDPSQERVLIVHYNRPDREYDGWNVWAWSEGEQGRGFPIQAHDAFGGIAVVRIDGPADRIGFIMRKGDWEARDGDRDRFAVPDERGVAEVWLSSGDERVFNKPGEVDVSVRVVNAFMDRLDLLTLVTTGPLELGEIRGARLVSDQNRYRLYPDPNPEIIGGRLVYDLRVVGRISVPDVKSLRLEFEEREPQTVYARDVLTHRVFDNSVERLGPDYRKSNTIFTTWSPVATKVELLLYEKVGDTEPERVIEMRPLDHTIWFANVEGDLDGRPYQYRFTSYGVERTAVDIHCFAATADLEFSVVVDLDTTDPADWAQRRSPDRRNQTDEIIYEIHVRDFTVADPTLDPGLRGTYLGMVEDTDDWNGVTTGLDHLRELGVTAVHLLPIHDYPSDRHDYNWGYWTSLFNVPEGTYSTADDEPHTRIRELKRAIKTLQDNGIRVILDVVYNHTSSSFEASPFYNTVPYYYFRTTRDGRLRNDTGVGNTVADERMMVRRYILDSLKFWIDEYGVDGFRFDLLGTHQKDTVERICDELLSIRPDLTLYGEPWTGGGPILFGKGDQRGLGMAVFNDDIRNAIRGGLDGPEKGFATGPGGDLDQIRTGVMGAIDSFASQPVETVTYTSAHDNLTLWDKIELTQPNAGDETRRAMHKLAMGIVLTSQGVAFLHGGSDFARTKYGNHNSYNAGDEINKFDYERKAEYIDVFDYSKGLVAIRRAQPSFRLPTANLIRTALEFMPGTELVAFTLDGDITGSGWDEIVVAYNHTDRSQHLDLPEGTWRYAADAERADPEGFGEAEGSVVMPAYSMVILFQP
ncbi:MAG: type I pullulanase [Planctomycetota bacterium]